MDSLKKPSNFGYYIKTENYEVFIPKIAREVYDLEHRKLRKRKLRGRKLRGHSVRHSQNIVKIIMNLQFFEKNVNKQLKSAEFFLRSENFDFFLVTNFGTRRLWKSTFLY